MRQEGEVTAVARATIAFHFADGAAVECELETESEHPDALDQMVARTVALYRDAIAEVE